MAAERRLALVAWARARDRLLIEDDYDAENRYDRLPIGALQGLDPSHVVHAGTASKTLAPGLRIGWLSLPAELVAPLVAMKNLADSGSPAIDQFALATLIERGDYERHVARARQEYRTRRDRLHGRGRPGAARARPARRGGGRPCRAAAARRGRRRGRRRRGRGGRDQRASPCRRRTCRAPSAARPRRAACSSATAGCREPRIDEAVAALAGLIRAALPTTARN